MGGQLGREDFGLGNGQPGFCACGCIRDSLERDHAACGHQGDRPPRAPPSVGSVRCNNGTTLPLVGQDPLSRRGGDAQDQGAGHGLCRWAADGALLREVERVAAPGLEWRARQEKLGWGSPDGYAAGIVGSESEGSGPDPQWSRTAPGRSA